MTNRSAAPFLVTLSLAAGLLATPGCSVNYSNWERDGYETLRRQQLQQCLEQGEENCYERYGERYEVYKARRDELLRESGQLEEDEEQNPLIIGGSDVGDRDIGDRDIGDRDIGDSENESETEQGATQPAISK